VKKWNQSEPFLLIYEPLENHNEFFDAVSEFLDSRIAFLNKKNKGC